MNPKTIEVSIKKRCLTKEERKHIYAYSKYMMEESTEQLEWFNIYSALYKTTVDWFTKRENIIMESRKEIVRMSVKYMRSNRLNIK